MDVASEQTVLPEMAAVAQARAALADRCRVIEARLLESMQQRLARRLQPGRSYPPNLAYHRLTVAQQTERCAVADDLLGLFGQWLGNRRLGERDQRFVMSLQDKLFITRRRYGISPSEWERIWEIRDYLDS